MGHTLMFRLTALWVVLSACVLYASSDGTAELDYIYSESDINNVTDNSLKCEGVEGRVPDCSECYSCDDDAVTWHKEQDHEITELKLNDANCESSETICCVSQKLLRFREKENADLSRCGKQNPEGYPRALRPKMRSVLQGEYPWRARIYHFQDPSTPLCAATFINQEGRTLLTAASCVDGLRPEALRVLFEEDPNNYDPIYVRKVDVHNDYDKDSHVNDIAVLSLASLPDWAHRACLPIQPALHGTACVAVSSEDYFINQVLPRQVKCNENDKPLDNSLMCALSYRGDYSPQFGGGLLCLDEQSSSDVYTVYGVYLHSIRDGLAAINTNVTHFADWIADRAREHRHLDWTGY